ncbi:di-trans,poly-cis-decaprenylcistransferase [Candidatus Gottesmanbacteria bacterium]|nr:di-trans,poly-cis-decaprenylcistransferase [Candidatus Gottesmanbacteria bacterium]
MANNIPVHIAIIMDGNRRWAKEHNLPVLAGHQRVSDEVLEPLVEHAAKRGVSFITFWAFSTENWNRDAKEVEGIMRIFRHTVRKRWQRLHDKGVKVRVIGDISRFAPDIRKALTGVMEQTAQNKKITAVFALNYGGRDEILRAVRSLPDAIRVTEQDFSAHLDTAGVPDPDLIIRTSGEMRLSGFLPWQSVYSELYFPVWHMPDFTPEKLDEAIEVYAKRKRRFGK